MSRHEKPWPKAKNTGWLSAMIQLRTSSSAMRKISARLRPTVPGAVGLLLGELADQHRDEDDVVDAEHHLHDRQGGKRDPGVRVEQQVEHAGAPAGLVWPI